MIPSTYLLLNNIAVFDNNDVTDHAVVFVDKLGYIRDLRCSIRCEASSMTISPAGHHLEGNVRDFCDHCCGWIIVWCTWCMNEAGNSPGIFTGDHDPAQSGTGYVICEMPGTLPRRGEGGVQSAQRRRLGAHNRRRSQHSAYVTAVHAAAHTSRDAAVAPKYECRPSHDLWL